MINKQWLLIGVIAGGAYLAGRYAGPDSEEIKKSLTLKVNENSELKKQIAENSELLKSVEKSTTTTIIETIEGRKITRVRENSKINTQSKKSRTDNYEETVESVISQTATEEKKTINRSNTVLISVAGQYSFSEPIKGVVPGVVIYKEFLGPFGFGVGYFTDLHLQLSLGLRL